VGEKGEKIFNMLHQDIFHLLREGEKLEREGGKMDM